jgi:hypothetical protein
MARTCKRCHCVNPSEAVYCHHDGALLDGRAGDSGAIDVGARPFSVPFILPTGTICRTFNELALACHAAPKAALDLLRAGHLESFLAAQGRADLARAAHVAARAPDRPRGLDDFLNQLPTSVLRPAKLRVAPEVIDLGTVRPGEDRTCELTLHNDGMRLLFGSASCDDCEWLSLGHGSRSKRRVFQFTDRFDLPVRVVGKNVRAFGKPQAGVILLESNGGTVSVTVRLSSPVKPFPEGVLAGALSPRELASKARDVPKEAAALIENGAVARWYQANGWEYPVPGPPAVGLAAVQQFFEALGLVKTPRVELSEESIRLQGRPGEKVEYTLAAITQENRAAVAHAKSDQPWLQVGATIFRGRSAFLPLTIAVAGRPGETLRATLSVTANGNQRFQVPVALEVGGLVRAAAPAATRPASPVSGGRSLWPALLPALLLVVLLLLAVARDVMAPSQGKPPSPVVELDPTPRLQIRYNEAKQNDLLDQVYFTDPQPTMRFGLVTLQNNQEVGAGANVRRLTFDPWGRTNNTCLRFDGKDERLFGGKGGRWEQLHADRWKDDQGQEHEGAESVWVYDAPKIAVTQHVELLRGEQSLLLDTCRVSYLIDNRDKKDHKVGVRFLLDTFIGGNDGVPFTIPGATDLCDTWLDLPAQAKDRKVPDFLQALEKPDLAHPGTIAHVRLKLENMEPPERVTLGAWPADGLRVIDKKANGPLTLWDVPVPSMKTLKPADSAVVIYWKDDALKPGARREVGFEYGLWNLHSQGSRLAATVDGVFQPERELTVVAYMNLAGEENADETATLELPDGFALIEGDKTQPVPKRTNAQSGNRPVTWRVRAGSTGDHVLKVTTSSGPAQDLPVRIKGEIFH